MDQKYYKNKESKYIYAHHFTISNGVILTEIDLETGRALGDIRYLFFVDNSDIVELYEEVDYQIPVNRDEIIEKKFVQLFRKMMKELPYHGCFEDGSENAEQIEYEFGVIKSLLFEDDFSLDSIRDKVKLTFPEDCADDILLSEYDTIFSFFLELRNPVREIVNELKKERIDA